MIIKKFINNNIKVFIAFIIGLILATTGVYATSILNSKEVPYSNANSGLSSTNVQSAIDELYNKTTMTYDTNSNIIIAYKYNESACVTGEEETCLVSACYGNKVKNSCSPGTIIKYKVNDTDIVNFHVMFDNGSTLILQSQSNTIDSISWYGSENDNSKGPLTVLSSLEKATEEWSNVNMQTYTMGTTVFQTNAYTGCSYNNYCNTNTYKLGERTARARMITEQEAYLLGCNNADKTCPVWMHNYLNGSTIFGGTVNLGSDYGYWTMNAWSDDSIRSFFVSYGGGMYVENTTHTGFGARAVVVINK